MRPASWSLARRLKTWFTLACVVPSVCAVAVGGWFLDASVERELRELLQEELDEAEVLSSRPGAPGFREITERLASHHPAVVMAWRLSSEGAAPIETGAPQLRPRLDELPEEGPASELGEDLVGGTRVLPTGERIGLVIDGRPRSALIHRYWGVALLMVAAGAIVAFLVAGYLARRVSRLLSQVATGLQDDTDSAGAAEPTPDEIRVVADRLRDTLQRIRGESDEMRMFMATLAHELRSPIQNLIGRAEVSLMRRRGDAEYEDILREQLEELIEFGNAVDNLMTLCAAEATADSGEQEEFDLADEIGVRLHREVQRAERHGIDFEIHTPESTRLLGDREAVMRAVRNVVANAVDWSHEGSSIRLEITRAGDRLVLTVDDAGPGVPADMRDVIFEPFRQCPSPEHRRTGFGLGLAIARKAVEAQGGSIHVTESPQGGARFRLEFRVALERAPVHA